MLSEIQFSVVTLKATSEGSQEESELPLSVESVAASVEQKNYPVKECIDGKLDTGWAIDGGSGIPAQAVATFRFDQQKLGELWQQARSDSQQVRLRIRLIQNHGSSSRSGWLSNLTRTRCCSGRRR